MLTRFCEAIGKPEWKEKPEWKTQVGRSSDRKAINAAIGEITKTKPAEHWIELLERRGIPCGPIYTIDQVFADPQVQHLRHGARRCGTRRCGETRRWWRRRSTSAGFSQGHPHADAGSRRAHGRGAASVGYSDAEIAEMRKKGAI